MAEMSFQRFEGFVALGHAAVIFVAEITELVAKQQQHAIILCDIGDPRTLGTAGPFGPVLLHQEGVDVAAHGKAKRLEIVLGGLFLIGSAIGDVEHLHAL
jgi:hypothetical protein